ncbi:MAG TPA: hypothetical protein VGP93_13290 [Polyangiaceae bacterium]|nr:hypothetical protein [Polyangiaceae bacterium]
MRPAWLRGIPWAALLAYPITPLLAACATRSAAFESSSVPADNKRRAPGVAVDPRAALPEPASSAGTDQGVVVLSSPPDPELARETVRRFFGAILREAPDEIDRLVGADAWVETGSQRQPVRAFWRARFAQLDYGSLSHEVVFRESELETFRPADVQRMGEGSPTFVETKTGDLIVRAKIRVSWAGKARLLGDELFFLLRPEGDQFLIAEIVEDFRLP